MFPQNLRESQRADEKPVEIRDSHTWAPRSARRAGHVWYVEKPSDHSTHAWVGWMGVWGGGGCPPAERVSQGLMRW